MGQGAPRRGGRAALGQRLGTPWVQSLRILVGKVHLWFLSCFEHQCALAPEWRAEPGPERGRLGLESRTNPPPASRAGASGPRGLRAAGPQDRSYTEAQGSGGKG